MTQVRLLPLMFLALALGAPDAATATDVESTQATPPPAESPRTRKEAAAAWTADGLEQVAIKGLDVAYLRPGASLQGYDKVLLRPVSIAFNRNWERGDRSHRRISSNDAQRIRGRLTGLVQEELAREFGKGGYVLTDQPGDGVLELDLRITELYISAPDLPSTAFTEVYAVSAGEMTLIAELRDAASGETLMRIYDNEEADSSIRVHRITRWENEEQARDVVGGWARALRTQLDLARAGPQG